MGIPVKGDQRIALAGSLAAITVDDVANYILAKQATPSPSTAGVEAALEELGNAQADMAARIEALNGHGPVSDAAAKAS